MDKGCEYDVKTRRAFQEDVYSAVYQGVQKRPVSHILPKSLCGRSQTRVQIRLLVHPRPGPEKPESGTNPGLFHGYTSPTTYGCYFLNLLRFIRLNTCVQKRRLGKLAGPGQTGDKPESRWRPCRKPSGSGAIELWNAPVRCRGLCRSVIRDNRQSRAALINSDLRRYLIPGYVSGQHTIGALIYHVEPLPISKDIGPVNQEPAH